MTTAEVVAHVRDVHLNLCRLAGLKGFRLLKAVAEAATKDITAHELLTAAELHIGRVWLGIGKVSGIHVDEFHDPVRISARRGDMQRGLQRTREREIFLKRFRLINQHVGARGNKALILDGISLWIGRGWIVGERHGFRRITDVFIKGRGLVFRRIKGERSAGFEIQGARRDLLRRPCIESAPMKRARLKDVCFGRGVCFIALEIVPEERQLDLLTVILRGLRVEADLAEFVTRTLAPLAVRPRTHDKHVVDAWIHALGVVIDFQRAKQIFGIKPAAHGHHGAVNVLEMRPWIAGLPEVIVVRMREKLRPLGSLSLEQFV